MQERVKQAYFAAANSARGFISYYAFCFGGEDVRRVYIVKGGPGTGKSRFLGDVANAARAQEYEVSYYYCSSDPLSLDGIVLSHPRKGKIALLDGTPPHAVEPTLPGVRDILVNLGDFWDRERLADAQRRIRILGGYKQQCFARAYEYLNTAGRLLDIRDGLIAPCTDTGRLQSAARKLARAMPTGKHYSEHIGLCGSIGMRGKVRLDTYAASAEHLVMLVPFYGLEYVMMDALAAHAEQKGSEVWRAPHPLRTDKIDTLYFPENGLCITTAAPTAPVHAEVRRYDLRRFCNPDALRGVRGEARLAQKMADSALDAATDSFARAGEYHFELESIYSSAMDFGAKERFTKSFCNAIL